MGFPLEPPEGVQSCQHLDIFYPSETHFGFLTSRTINIFVSFYDMDFVIICYSGNGKETQGERVSHADISGEGVPYAGFSKCQVPEAGYAWHSTAYAVNKGRIVIVRVREDGGA